MLIAKNFYIIFFLFLGNLLNNIIKEIKLIFFEKNKKK